MLGVQISMADGVAEFMRADERAQRIRQVVVKDDVLDPVKHRVVSECRLHEAVRKGCACHTCWRWLMQSFLHPWAAAPLYLITQTSQL